jgi:hypothetical protein
MCLASNEKFAAGDDPVDQVCQTHSPQSFIMWPAYILVFIKFYNLSKHSIKKLVDYWQNFFFLPMEFLHIFKCYIYYTYSHSPVTVKIQLALPAQKKLGQFKNFV